MMLQGDCGHCVTAAEEWPYPPPGGVHAVAPCNRVFGGAACVRFLSAACLRRGCGSQCGGGAICQGWSGQDIQARDLGTLLLSAVRWHVRHRADLTGVSEHSLFHGCMALHHCLAFFWMFSARQSIWLHNHYSKLLSYVAGGACQAADLGPRGARSRMDVGNLLSTGGA